VGIIKKLSTKETLLCVLSRDRNGAERSSSVLGRALTFLRCRSSDVAVYGEITLKYTPKDDIYLFIIRRVWDKTVSVSKVGIETAITPFLSTTMLTTRELAAKRLQDYL
jgi:hypothetical protein